jgi:hypothetical protein
VGQEQSGAAVLVEHAQSPFQTKLIAAVEGCGPLGRTLQVGPVLQCGPLEDVATEPVVAVASCRSLGPTLQSSPVEDIVTQVQALELDVEDGLSQVRP